METAKDGALMTVVRKLLTDVRKRCFLRGFFGLPWCKRRGESPFGGSIAVYEERGYLVVVWQQDGNGPVCTRTYTPGPRSDLESEIRHIICQAGIPLAGPR